MEEKKSKKELVAICLFVFSLVLIAIGTTFAFFTYSKQGTTVNKLESGTLTFIYDENRKEKNGVSLTNAFPISDEEGTKQTGTGFFEFQVRSKARGASIYYEIYLTKDNNSTLPEYAVKTYLTEVSDTGTETGVSNLFTSEAINLYSELGESKVPSLLKQEVIGKTLYQGSVSEEEITKTFRYRMWIDNDTNQVRGGEWIHNNKTFSVKVNVYAQNNSIPGPTNPAEICNDSNVNEPKLVDGMIPVYYDYEEGTWKKANAKTANWYNYCNQEWANAVTIGLDEDGGTTQREEYQKASPDTPIEMDDINTMWVWIPRYEYNFVSIESVKGEKGTCAYQGNTYDCYPNPGEIEINFINGTSKQESDPTNYKMHPAFTFGEKELTGLWFAKFEPSNEEKKFTINAGSNSSYLTPTIKPNTTSWRHIQVANAFYASRKMQTEKYEVYGFKANDESYDTHMSKNIEWASVAYLSQSQYGKYGNNTYAANDKEVYINNCAQYITGIAGDTTSAEASDSTCTENTYETLKGQKASTTGNITGVYDMSGGALEYVMGAMDDGSNKPMIYKSGFTDNGGTSKLPDAKYYDLYTSNTPSQACDGQICYGHALSETEGWYSDHGDFDWGNSWLRRDGRFDGSAVTGAFAFQFIPGDGGGNNCFRVVLASCEA